MNRRDVLKGILGASAVAIAPKALTEVDKGLLCERPLPNHMNTNCLDHVGFDNASWVSKDECNTGEEPRFSSNWDPLSGGKLYDEKLNELPRESSFADWKPHTPYYVFDVVVNAEGQKMVAINKLTGNI